MNRMYRRREFQLVTLSLDDLDKKETALKVLREQKVARRTTWCAPKDRDRFADVLDKPGRGRCVHLVIAPGGKCCTQGQQHRPGWKYGGRSWLSGTDRTRAGLLRIQLPRALSRCRAPSTRTLACR